MRNKSYLGVDIGYSTIRLLELTGKKIQDAEITAYEKENIPIKKELSVDSAEYIENIATVLKKLWIRSKSKTKNISISIPSNAVMSIKKTLPIMDEDDLYLYSLTEIEGSLPDNLRIDEVIVDCQIKSIDKKNDEMVVDIFASRADVVDKMVDIVQLAGLNPVIVDTESNAIKNGLQLMGGERFKSERVALFDMGATSLKILVFTNGELSFTRESEISGNDLSKELMKELDITMEKSEEYKTNKKIDPKADLVKRLFLNKYVAEAVRLLQVFYNQDKDNKLINNIILVGGMADINDIEVDVQKELYISDVRITGSVKVGRLLINVKSKNKELEEKIRSDDAGLFLVSSLAYRNILRNY